MLSFFPCSSSTFVAALENSAVDVPGYLESFNYTYKNAVGDSYIFGFGKSSFYFGANVPGKPRRYLLNAAGRPKLLAMVAELRDNDYASCRFTSVADEASQATTR